MFFIKTDGNWLIEFVLSHLEYFGLGKNKVPHELPVQHASYLKRFPVFNYNQMIPIKTHDESMDSGVRSFLYKLSSFFIPDKNQ